MNGRVTVEKKARSLNDEAEEGKIAPRTMKPSARRARSFEK